MVSRVGAVLVVAALSVPGVTAAQQSAAPIPLYRDARPSAIAPEPLPPIAPAGPAPGPQAIPDVASAPASLAPAAMSPAAQRVFCGQSVTVQFADPDAIPERHRTFVGMFSDAAWTPRLCAALIVENVTADGTATIVYAFGPMGTNSDEPGGVLHGTGIVKDGELRFQNSDGSQFAFRPLYADLAGRLTTPQGQTYQAVFKKTL
jgi:hypothetical protein